jgi:hypothetical protein
VVAVIAVIAVIAVVAVWLLYCCDLVMMVTRPTPLTPLFPPSLLSVLSPSHTHPPTMTLLHPPTHPQEIIPYPFPGQALLEAHPCLSRHATADPSDPSSAAAKGTTVTAVMALPVVRNAYMGCCGVDNVVIV